MHDEPPQASPLDCDAGSGLTDSEWLRAILDATPDAVLLFSPDGCVRFANRAAAAAIGLAPGEMVGRGQHELFPPEVAEKHLEGIRRVYETGQPLVIERRAFLGDSQLWVRSRLSPVRDGAGRISAVAIIASDITAQVLERRALELDEARLEALLRLARMQDATIEELAVFTMEEAVRLTGSDIGYLAFLNEDESVLTMHAWSRHAMEQCRVQERPIVYPVVTTGLWGEAVRQRVPLITNDYAADSPLKKGYPEGHVPIRRHMNVPIFDGESIVAVIGVGNKDGDYEESDIRQVTLLGAGMWRAVRQRRAADERARIDARMQEARKLEALGQLAGGVAHDFNNIIQAILGNTDLALMSTSPMDRRREYLEEVRAASERAAGLTRQLLAFSRRERLDPKPLDLGALLRGLSKMLTRLIGEHIDLVVETPRQVPPVVADPGQIEQVILNLAVNARDAMPGGGRLTLSLAETTLDDAHSRSLGVPEPGAYVALTVADCGAGIPPEVRTRIFEPFFTTKGPGKGTGLGLAMVYGIVRQHGGAISVHSEVGAGTTFRVYLPASPEAVIEGAAGIERSDDDLHGSETILLAEDEPAVRVAAERLLGDAGYRVLSAADGQEAIQLALARADDISLALLDVVMPRASGPVVAEILTQANPNARVLFTSGYAPDNMGPRMEALANADLLSKPYTARQLLTRIRQALDAPRAETAHPHSAMRTSDAPSSSTNVG